MKHLKTKILALAIFLCGLSAFTAQAQAAQSSDILRLTLDDVLAIALSESPTIKIADKEIQRVDYSKKSAWNNVLPSLSASGQYAHFLVPGEMAMMGQVMDAPTTYNATVGLNLSLPIFAPALWHNIKMTTLDMQLAQERAQASKIQLRNDVTVRFYDVLLAQDSYNSLLSSFSLAEEAYRQANTRFELGLGSEFDAISAEVMMMSIKPNLLLVETGIETAKMMLKILMGIDINQPLAIAGNLADYEIDMKNADYLLNNSLENNSDLRQLSIQQQQLELALRMQRTQRMPTLAGFATYGYQGMGNRDMTISFGGMPIQVEKSNDWFNQGLIAGVQLNIPLSGILTNRSNERQTRLQIEQVDIQREVLEQSLSMQLQTAISNMNSLIKQAEVAQKNLNMAQRAYDISVKRFEVGAGAFIETQNALNMLTATNVTYHQAIFNFLSARANLERLLGERGF